MSYPAYLYNWVGSEDDANTRATVDKLVGTGVLEIPSTLASDAVERLMKLAQLIGYTGGYIIPEGRADAQTQDDGERRNAP